MTIPVPTHPRITTAYGVPGSWSAGYHTGADFGSAGIDGAAVVACQGGVVQGADWGPSYGTQVHVRHWDGTQAMYAHLSHRDVSPGQSVNPGDRLGRVGSTGNSTGPHLHLELRVHPYRYGHDARNPQPIIDYQEADVPLSEEEIQTIADRTAVAVWNAAFDPSPLSRGEGKQPANWFLRMAERFAREAAG